MKNLFIIVFYIIYCSGVLAQPYGDSIIFRAMKDELDRTVRHYTSPEYKDKPVYVRFMLFDKEKIVITASKGVLMEPAVKTHGRWGVPIIFFSDSFLNEQKIPYPAEIISLDDNYNNIRQGFWRLTERTYKDIYNEYLSDKKEQTANQLTEKKGNLLYRIPSVRANYIGIPDIIDFNITEWEKQVVSLSEEFDKYKYIKGNNIEIAYLKTLYYHVSNDSSMLKIPYNLISVKISAEVYDITENKHEAGLQFFTKNDMSRLSVDMIKKEINDMCVHLKDITNAPIMDKSYEGPVLIEDEAVISLFSNQLSSNHLIDSPLVANTGMYRRESKLGTHVCDNKLSISSYSNINEYKGTKVLGKHSIDYNGVTPKNNMQIIKNGILLNPFVVGLYTTDVNLTSTGHTLSFVQDYAQLKYTAIDDLYPGLIHITSSKTVSYKALKQKLLKSAKNKGSDYAYIIRKIHPATVYKVDVKTGNEELISPPNLQYLFEKTGNLSQIVYDAISKEEYISDTGLYTNPESAISIIAPKAFLIDNVKLTPNSESNKKLF